MRVLVVDDDRSIRRTPKAPRKNTAEATCREPYAGRSSSGMGSSAHMSTKPGTAVHRERSSRSTTATHARSAARMTPRTSRVKCRNHNGLAAERVFGRDHIERKRSERRGHPLQRGEHDGLALRALCGMGFKEGEARRALTIVEERTGGVAPPIEAVLRQALSLLT
jgi:hypothetical protein